MSDGATQQSALQCGTRLDDLPERAMTLDVTSRFAPILRNCPFLPQRDQHLVPIDDLPDQFCWRRSLRLSAPFCIRYSFYIVSASLIQAAGVSARWRFACQIALTGY
jgi:hypothetical protein